MGQMTSLADANAYCLRPDALEPEFWKMLEQICVLEGVTCTKIVADMHDVYGEQKLAPVIRVFILNYYLPRRADHDGPSAPERKRCTSEVDSSFPPPT